MSRRCWNFVGGVTSECEQHSNRQGDYAVKEDTKASEFALLANAGSQDPLEDGMRQRVRGFIEAIFEEELHAAPGRGR